MIAQLVVISAGFLAAVLLAVLLLSALARDLYRAHRRRVKERELAELDDRIRELHSGFTEWCAREVDTIWTERRPA